MDSKSKNDPSQPLHNARHEAFALAVAKGASATDAYRRAGYRAKDADVTGPRLLGDVGNGIAARVDWIKLQAASDTVLTIREKREFLASVVRTPIGEIDEGSPLCQSVKIGSEGEREYKMPCKIRSILADNDLAGEGSEAKANEAVAESLAAKLRKRANR
jgi:phage terminase small subunit